MDWECSWERNVDIFSFNISYVIDWSINCLKRLRNNDKCSSQVTSDVLNLVFIGFQLNREIEKRKGNLQIYKRLSSHLLVRLQKFYIFCQSLVNHFRIIQDCGENCLSCSGDVVCSNWQKTEGTLFMFIWYKSYLLVNWMCAGYSYIHLSIFTKYWCVLVQVVP